MCALHYGPHVLLAVRPAAWQRSEKSEIWAVSESAVALLARRLVQDAPIDELLSEVVGGDIGAAEALLDEAHCGQRLLEQVVEQEHAGRAAAALAGDQPAVCFP